MRQRGIGLRRRSGGDDEQMRQIKKKRGDQNIREKMSQIKNRITLL